MQVWNPALWKGTLFLDFVPEGKKCISYAASMGVDHLSDQEERYLQKQLERFSSISVREIGANILLSDLLNREITTVLDPTLLFSSEFWDTVAASPEITEPYVFVYMIFDDALTKKNIYEFCKRMGLRMVSIPHTQGRFKAEDERYSDILAYDIGPREWIGYIRHAKYIFVDSFHGTAFSVLYHKNFWCFECEPAIESPVGCLRMESLLVQLGLQERIIRPRTFFPDLQLCQKIDYTEIQIRLELLRKKSESYLRNALKE